MAEPVYVIGAGRTDFQRNLRKEGKSLRHLVLEAGRAAVTDAGLDAADIQAGVLGNFAAGLFTRQLHLGALLTELDERLRGLPTLHVEAACASGGVAVLTAAQQIMGGLRDVVLVVGVEQQKTMPPADGADVLAAAADFGVEKPAFGEHLFPKLFARIAGAYRERHGLTDRQLACIAAKNHAHARLNPLAQKRDSTLTLAGAATESEANPRLAPPLKLTDCSPITDGSAAVVLCSGRFLKRIGRPGAMRLLGCGHTTDYLPLARKDAPDFTIAGRAADQAYAMAGLTPVELDGAEVHDCFSITEIVAYEVLGLAPRGQGARWAESGATALPAVRAQLDAGPLPPGLRPLPVNTSGGLIGDGHPVGATGVRQVETAYRQFTGTAGAYQIAGARRLLTFNLGGSFTTSVVMLWGSEVR